MCIIHKYTHTHTHSGSATWPSEKNPLRDFDADFLKKYHVKVCLCVRAHARARALQNSRTPNPKLQTLNQGFPATTGTANWPFTKNPLLGFDEGFKNKWKGWEGPEYNVYAKLPPEYPFLEVTHTHTLTLTLTHTHTHTHTCRHTRNYMYMYRICVYMCIYMVEPKVQFVCQIASRSVSHTHALTRARAHTHTQTHRHKYAHIYVCISGHTWRAQSTRVQCACQTASRIPFP
jgi:hypothetical protein